MSIKIFLFSIFIIILLIGFQLTSCHQSYNTSKGNENELKQEDTKVVQAKTVH